MNFAPLLQEIREKKYTDIQIAEELTKMTGVPITRQRVYNYRMEKRPNPALFEICTAIIALHKKVVGAKNV